MKVEQERIALKEQQFVRQVHKLETDGRRELDKARERADTERLSRDRDHERAVEELEDRLNRQMDENEDLRRKLERVERAAWEHRQQAESLSKREERQAEQYERIVEGLRVDVREKEREVANIELRENFKKEELAREVKELQNTAKKASEELSIARVAEQRASDESKLMRAEVATLKGVIEEGDRSREVLLRELSRQKEQEQDKLRDAEQRREGSIKLQERMTMNLQRDKKELETRIEELVQKMDAAGAKYREQHHNTVKYFEGQVAQLQVQLNRFQHGVTIAEKE